MLLQKKDCITDRLETRNRFDVFDGVSDDEKGSYDSDWSHGSMPEAIFLWMVKKIHRVMESQRRKMILGFPLFEANCCSIRQSFFSNHVGSQIQMFMQL